MQPRWWLPPGVVLALVAGAFVHGGALEAQRRPKPARQPAQAASTRPAAAAAARAAASPPAAPVAPGALSPRNASYWIEASLDPARHALTGKETITWRNISGATTSELRFHLYYNAWKNTRSTWLREALDLSRRPIPLQRLGDDDWGWTQVTALRLVGVGGAPPIDLTSSLAYAAPDDGNPDDQTVLVAPLPRAVAPGETVNVAVEWSAHVPRTFARTGVIGRSYFLAQWFPKIGVLEDSGWNCHQFHASTEFFADYGLYDVYLTVPKGWVVGATGVERDSRENGDTATHHFYQEDVHDFAWTTSPDYLVRTARFEHAGLPPVEMRLLLQPEHASQADRHFEATRTALRDYGTWFGAYPYGHITIVDPAWQSGAGGMEYPTLFTAGSRWLLAGRVDQPEGVTIHECGHQFWYGIVGNNEFEDAWLDEGFNTYSTARAEEEAYTPNYYAARFFGGFFPWAYRDVPLSRVDGDGLGSYRQGARLDVPSTPSWRYFPTAGGPLSYSKTALWLHTLERYLGWPTMQRVMSTYFARWKFHHPKPADFFAVVNEVSGRDMTWFFDQVYRSSNVFDYALDDLRSTPEVARGLVDRGGKRESLGQPAAPTGGGAGRFHTVVVARRLGEAIFPVDVQVTFGNGDKVRQRWDGRERWVVFTYDRPSPAVSAEVDPDRVLLLDVNFTNNSRTLSPAAHAAAHKWSLKWTAWLEDLLLTYAFFI
jgi:hypothetical protein